LSLEYRNLGNAEDYRHSTDLSLLDQTIALGFNTILAAEEVYAGLNEVIDEENPSLDYRAGSKKLKVHPRYADLASNLANSLDEGKTAKEILEGLEK
jgi:hypothetical protein